MSHSLLKIGELARLTGSQAETIRYYEREGLLPAPGRSEGNYRLYDDAHVERLQFIRHCRSLDMTLGESGNCLPSGTRPNKIAGWPMICWIDTSGMWPTASKSSRRWKNN